MARIHQGTVYQILEIWNRYGLFRAYCDDLVASKAAYEKQYQVFRKLLKASYKEINFSEIMDCIDKIIIYPNKGINVKWSIVS